MYYCLIHKRTVRFEAVVTQALISLWCTVKVWTLGLCDSDYSRRLTHSENAFPGAQSDPALSLLRCWDIEHVLRGPVISVLSARRTRCSFMWLHLCESFRSGSEHVVVFSLLTLKALPAGGEISHGRLPAERFESSKQSQRPNVENFGNVKLPWVALCPKTTERACVWSWVLPFLLLFLL